MYSYDITCLTKHQCSCCFWFWQIIELFDCGLYPLLFFSMRFDVVSVLVLFSLNTPQFLRFELCVNNSVYPLYFYVISVHMLTEDFKWQNSVHFQVSGLFLVFVTLNILWKSFIIVFTFVGLLHTVNSLMSNMMSFG
jgi:hypothetical protein